MSSFACIVLSYLLNCTSDKIKIFWELSNYWDIDIEPVNSNIRLLKPANCPAETICSSWSFLYVTNFQWCI